MRQGRKVQNRRRTRLWTWMCLLRGLVKPDSLHFGPDFCRLETKSRSFPFLFFALRVSVRMTTFCFLTRVKPWQGTRSCFPFKNNLCTSRRQGLANGSKSRHAYSPKDYGGPGCRGSQRTARRIGACCEL